MIVSSRLLLSKKIKKKIRVYVLTMVNFISKYMNHCKRYDQNIHMTLISQKLVSLVVSFIDSAVCIKLEGILKSIT